MNDDTLDIALIEKFREGQLTETERNDFDQRLLTDNTFAEAVKVQLNIVEEIEVFWTNDILEKIKLWEVQAKNKESENTTLVLSQNNDNTAVKLLTINENEAMPTAIAITKNWTRYLVAATILLVISLGSWYFLNNPLAKEDLFVTNFEPYPDMISTQSTEESDLLSIGMAAYSNGDFMVALSMLQPYLNKEGIENSDRNAAEFYIAISELASGNVNTATTQLKAISEDGMNFFQKQADWYLALAYLSGNKIEAAKKQLAIIVSSDDYGYQEKATVLLKVLRNKHSN